MLLAIITLGGAILGATTIAGLLILFQVKATEDAVHSTQAIFAADSGTEWALFDFYCQEIPGRCVPGPQPLPGANGVLGNGATTSIQCFDATNATTPCDQTSTAIYAIAKGNSFTSRRAFFLDYAATSSTLP